jgi:hypothetical protein
MMKFFLGVSLLAVATAFTTQPLTFRTSHGGRDGSIDIIDQEKAHHERRSTILMDGKANGE